MRTMLGGTEGGRTGMALAVPHQCTYAEYLEAEARGERFHDGTVVAIAGGSPEQSLLITHVLVVRISRVPVALVRVLDQCRAPRSVAEFTGLVAGEAGRPAHEVQPLATRVLNELTSFGLFEQPLHESRT